MDLSTLTLSDFKNITSLLVRKGDLQAEIADIDRELSGIGSGTQVAAKAPKAGKVGRPAKPAKLAKVARIVKGRRMKRGQMKENIISLLKGAGKEGLSVREIATKLKVKPANVHVWFGSTGKKVSEIKKDKGRRVWVG